MSGFDCVGIIVNPGIPEAPPLARQTAAWLASKGLKTAVGAVNAPGADLRMDDAEPLAAVIAKSDLLVTLGGDGTLLGVARALGSETVPILAVNLGNLGFLTSVTRDELNPSLLRALEGDFETDERWMLHYEMQSKDGATVRGSALNDLVIRDNAHLISLRVGVNDESRFTMRADGLIVATPTGSTAYSVASGGPIAHPSCEAIILTPISPFTLGMRPMVVPSGACVEIAVVSKAPSGALRADGQEQQPLKEGSVVRVRRDAKTIALVRSRKRDFYAVLRAKLLRG